jgi:sugar O-acyltransferase (sialic acid O-acetyltransferase NeuD family)
MNNPVIIFGAKQLGQAAKAILESNDVVIYGFLDDDTTLHNKEIGDVMVLGKTEDDGFLKLIGKKCDAFIAFDNNKLRKNTVEMLKNKRKVMPMNAIHKTAWVEQSAHLGHGNFINMGVKIGNNAKIANHCIINSNATIDHAAELGDLVQIGAGTIINTEAVIGDEVFIGAGAVVVSGVKIGKGARVGVGSVVIADVKAGETVFGNPAAKVG